MRLWGGRFSEENDQRVADFTRSIEVDAGLAADDLAGSIAHVRGLGRAGLLTGEEVDELVGGLDGARRGRGGRPDRLGPLARGRPHEPRGGAGRADRPGRRQAAHRPVAQRPGRHGPAALDAPGDRSPGRREPRLRARARRARRARGRGDPARARPTSSRPSRSCSPITCWRTSRWSSATAAGWPMRAAGSNVSPLGAGALAGAGYPLDREATARGAGFDGVTANSLDAVSDRDFVVETLGGRSRSGWST